MPILLLLLCFEWKWAVNLPLLRMQLLRKHALQVMQQLGMVIKGLGDLGCLIPKITALAQRHVGYGVQLSHYELLGRALLGTLEQVLHP